VSFSLGQELQALFHRLNNQLGIVLAHAELLEAKASDAANRERAAQVVSGALAALGTVREICQRTEPSSEQLA
jgi:hypothetical protein